MPVVRQEGRSVSAGPEEWAKFAAGGAGRECHPRHHHAAEGHCQTIRAFDTARLRTARKLPPGALETGTQGSRHHEAGCLPLQIRFQNSEETPVMLAPVSSETMLAPVMSSR